MISVRGAQKAYGDKVILDDIELSVSPGECVAVLGPSGSGKSTLLRMMSMLDRPTKGTISVDKQSWSFPQDAQKAFDVWPKVGMVFQDLYLWPHLSCGENALLPARKRGVLDTEDKVNSFTKQFGLDGLIGSYPNQVSRGQRQLFALLRAAILEPRYLLVDEITASLDLERIDILTDYLRRMAKNGAGVVIASHQLRFACEVAERYYFLTSGKIIDSGRIADLKSTKEPAVKRFVDLAMRY
jgi:ABC-type polar amino acid transport system ATPase subunit